MKLNVKIVKDVDFFTKKDDKKMYLNEEFFFNGKKCKVVCINDYGYTYRYVESQREGLLTKPFFVRNFAKGAFGYYGHSKPIKKNK